MAASKFTLIKNLLVFVIVLYIVLLLSFHFYSRYLTPKVIMDEIKTECEVAAPEIEMIREEKEEGDFTLVTETIINYETTNTLHFRSIVSKEDELWEQTDKPIIITDFLKKRYSLPCPVFYVWLGKAMPKFYWCMFKQTLKLYHGEHICLVYDDDEFITPYKQIIHIKSNILEVLRVVRCLYRYYDFVELKKGGNQKIFVTNLSDLIRLVMASRLQAAYYDSDMFVFKRDISPNTVVRKCEGDSTSLGPKMHIGNNFFNISANVEYVNDLVEGVCGIFEHWAFASLGLGLYTREFERRNYNLTVKCSNSYGCTEIRNKRSDPTKENIKWVEDNCVYTHFTAQNKKLNAYDGKTLGLFFERAGMQKNEDECVEDLDPKFYGKN